MTYVLDWPAGFQTRLVPVVQGEFMVSSDPDTTFTTILGSCVSVCLFDDEAKVGGMNHYLLADGGANSNGSLRYGAHAMELLINGLLKGGASRSNLKAKVFGGGMMSSLFHDIGQKNGNFALQYLSDEGIPITAKDLGGSSARRINFHPITGQVRCAMTEGNVAVPEKPKPVAASSIELF